MQFTRFITFVCVFFSFGFILSSFAAPIPASELTERGLLGGFNDDPVLSILATLQAKVKTDIAVVANLVATAEVDLNLYVSAFAVVIADINTSVTALLALPAAVVGLSAIIIATTVAQILIDIFVVVQSVVSIPNITSAYAGLNDVLVALLTQLGIRANGVLLLITPLSLAIKVVLNLNINISIFAELVALLGL